MIEIPGLPWDLDNVPTGIIDPADRLRSADNEPRAPRRPQTAQEPPRVDARAFAQAVYAERVRLALLDPDGEPEAVGYIPQERARRIMLAMAAQNARRAVPHPSPRHGDRRPDGRELLSRLGADPNRGRGAVRCPAHEDRSPSLSWRLADDGRALVHCFSGCSFAEILEAIR